MIEVKGLVKRYGNNLAVDHIDFTIEKGRIYGLLGPNGAGKSTTMNIMTGYIGATEGDVIINGHSIIDEPELAKNSIGYLPEIPPLYTDMTPLEYLRFAAELKKIPADKVDAEVNKALNRTGTMQVRNRLISNLSKGYKQRVGLAQAILNMPDIIILDEPTVGLDPKQIIEIRDLIKALGREHTVILSSHILSEVQAVCDEILIIHRGKLVARGTPNELEEQLGSHSLDVVVKKEYASAVCDAVRGIEGIKSVSSVASANGETAVSMMLEKTADIRAEVFSALVAANIPVLELKHSGFSLEKVFIDLTMDSTMHKEIEIKEEEEKK